jgi:F-type H+-transporting ATPase subunit delta
MTENANHDTETTADIGSQRIGRVYAEALLNAAAKHGEVDGVLESLQALVKDVFRADPALELFFNSAVVGRDRRARSIESIFRPRAGDVFTNFLLVLNQHDRLNLLRPILAAARELSDERARRIRVRVESAVPLPENQREQLKKQLRQSLKLEPILETTTDPEIIGGLVVHVGDWLYDGSVRSQLETLRKQLIASSAHEIQSGRNRFSSSD